MQSQAHGQPSTPLHRAPPPHFFLVCAGLGAGLVLLFAHSAIGCGAAKYSAMTFVKEPQTL